MPAAEPITLNSEVSLSADALIQLTGNEAIVLDIAGERYYGLNEVGARLWTLLKADASLERSHAQLLEEFDVAPGELEADLIAIVGRLRDAGLATVA
jgi:hypothetical protein